MHPTLVREPFHRLGWVYERKEDGWRFLAYKEGSTVRLISRRGVDHTARFADITAAVAKRRPLVAALFGALALFSGCTTISPEQRTDNIPMYGQPAIPRPDIANRSDEAFIKAAAAPFGGNRRLASNASVGLAEQYMREGNLVYAMRRYNQAWLLDPSSCLPYWGFGRVMVARRQYRDAVEYFEKAKTLINDAYQKPALLSDTGTAYSYLAESLQSDREEEKTRHFAIANEHFEQATALDASYLEGWEYWAYSLFHEARYADAWDKVREARARGVQFTDVFITNLTQKMPEPKHER